MGKRRIRTGPPANGGSAPAVTLARASTPMAPATLARLLSRAEEAEPAAGISAALIRRHIAAGAPADERGRISLLDYAAWLIGSAGAEGTTGRQSQ